MIRRLINSYRFTLSEQRSIISLCFLLVVINGIKFFISGQDRSAEIQFQEAEVINIEAANNDLSVIPSSPRKSAGKVNPAAKSRVIEINSADSIELLDLYGIGPSFAGRIIKYRNLLGGYFNSLQLLEVYGMDTLRYDGFKKLIWVDTLRINKMDLNTFGFRDFLRHPYLDYEDVKALVGYRDRNGPFLSTKVLWRDSVLPGEKMNKLQHYLTVK